jgi:hypothetical protein
MTDTIRSLQRKMEEAVEALDFEEAKRCRDRISLMRGGASGPEAEQADLRGIDRTQPGAMGLGSGRGRPSPSNDWQRPAKPDPMTTGRARRRKRAP